MSYDGEMQYIVFQDNLGGFRQMTAMTTSTLEEAIDSIHNGCTGCNMPSQNFMYYIYKRHEQNVPIIGTRFDVYKRVKAVAGSRVEKPSNAGHEYALTHNSSMAWFFTDDIFGDH
jgi:hypothetical protein